MQLWQQITEFFLRLIDGADDPAIFLFVVFEEMGPGLALPGELVKVLGGYRVAQGKTSLLWTLLLFEAATLLGASILYWMGARGGRPLVYRCAPFFHFDLARLERVETWVRHRGAVAVLLGRLIPGARLLVVLMAGVLGVPYRIFLPALALGSLVYILPWVLLGMWGGPQAMAIIGQVELPLRAVLTVALFVGLSAILVVLYRRTAWTRQELPSGPISGGRRLETAALAGCLATFEMMLGVNVALYALAALGLAQPEGALMQLVERGAPLYTEGSTPRFFLHLTFVLVLGNLACALVYAYVADSALPGPAWLRGLLFAPVPLVVSQAALMPFLGSGPFGLGLDAGLWPIAGELFRNALFGLSLGVFYALLRAARQVPPVSEAAGAIDGAGEPA